MSRIEKNNVEYFPFYCREGASTNYIEKQYGNNGFAIWVKILRFLATEPFHFLDLSQPKKLMFVLAKCSCDEDLLFRILKDLATLDEIDEKFLSKKIVYSDVFIKSVAEAYRKRTNNLLKKAEFIDMLVSIRRLNEQEAAELLPDPGESSAGNPQIKEDKTKGNNTIENNINDASQIHPLQSYIIKSCVNVCKLKDQLTFVESKSLYFKFPKAVLRDVIAAMENKPALAKNYKSVYLTINNWAKRQEIKIAGQPKFPKYYDEFFARRMSEEDKVEYEKRLLAAGFKPVFDTDGKLLDMKKEGLE